MNTVSDGVPRLVVVRCPDWPVVAAARAPDAPVAVVTANRVLACSLVAAASGVGIGQRRREAQRRCPEVQLVEHDPARDHRAFQPVAAAVADLVPRLELTEPGVLTFPTRGPSRYLGGDDRLADRLLELVTEVLGEQAAAVGPPGVGIADGRFAASVAADLAIRSAKTGQRGPRVIAPGASAAFLAPLSVRRLLDATSGAVGIAPAPVVADLVGLLQRLGIRKLGELAALPPADVLARFGRVGVMAQLMAAARDERPPGTEEPPAGSEVVHHFDTPVQHLDALVFVGRQLAERFVGALGATGRVCTQLVVTAETDHGERSERVWTRTTGLNAPAVVERIRWQLDGWAGSSGAGSMGASMGPTAGIVRLAIEAVEVHADDGVQLGLWGGRTQVDDWAQRAMARLAGILGDERVLVPAWRGSRHPSEAYQWVPAASCEVEQALDRVTPPPSTTGGPWPGSLPAPSPAIVYEPAVEIVVIDGGGVTVLVTGRGGVSGTPSVLRQQGRDEVIEAWAGPWVLEERWWDAVRSRRAARFQLLTTSGRAYLAAVERGRWWILAEYA